MSDSVEDRGHEAHVADGEYRVYDLTLLPVHFTCKTGLINCIPLLNG